MLLDVQDLWCSFGGVAAVAGVDFQVADGELRCLIGANGAGKSTFFKMLSGLQRPTSGRILFFGQSIAGLTTHEIARKGVAVKTQVPSLFNGLCVRENLYIAARRFLPRSMRRDAVDEMLETINLTAVADTQVDRLSHGHRQWVELGMILVTDPRLVLLDEPAAGMTPPEVERTVEVINNLRGKRTFIIVEHDMHFIRRIADKVTVLHRGQILVEDTMEEILRNPDVKQAYLGRQGGQYAK